jgi:hypothetical protein
MNNVESMLELDPPPPPPDLLLLGIGCVLLSYLRGQPAAPGPAPSGLAPSELATPGPVASFAPE